ncbi:MAG: succinate dehydrogenase / fumarate reductase cytochrome b subunit [Paracoccaceae bacterium]|jgi:succinate dehydrogenase / fumarate reductase cytochrome b subunit
MADIPKSNRPLSPHLTIYRREKGMMMSIVHRIAGAGLTLTLVLIVWWFLAAATSENYFSFVDGLLTSWLGSFVLLISLWAFWYHFFNGVRHLRWDFGKGLGLGESSRTGWYVIILSILFTTFSIYLTL